MADELAQPTITASFFRFSLVRSLPTCSRLRLWRCSLEAPWAVTLGRDFLPCAGELQLVGGSVGGPDTVHDVLAHGARELVANRSPTIASRVHGNRAGRPLESPRLPGRPPAATWLCTKPRPSRAFGECQVHGQVKRAPHPVTEILNRPVRCADRRRLQRGALDAVIRLNDTGCRSAFSNV